MKSFTEILPKIGRNPYIMAKRKAITWKLADDGSYSINFKVDYSKIPEMRHAFSDNASVTYNYVTGQMLLGGPKIINLDSTDFGLLEMTDLNLSVDDYVQPFPCVVINLPESYQRVINSPAGTFIPRAVILLKEPGVLFTATFDGTGHSYVSQFLNAIDMIEQDFQRKIEVNGEAIRPFYGVLRACMNACFVMNQFGVNRLPPSNPKHEARLDRAVEIADNAADRERAIMDRRMHPVVYAFKREVQLYRTEQTPRHDGDIGVVMTPHWRRGHYRKQRFGPANAEMKTIWISPVFVNSYLFAGELADAITIYKQRSNHASD